MKNRMEGLYEIFLGLKCPGACAGKADALSLPDNLKYFLVGTSSKL